MNIDLLFDSAAQAAPAAFKAEWEDAVALLGGLLTNDEVTANIEVEDSGSGGGGSGAPDTPVLQADGRLYSRLTSNALLGDTTFTGLPSPGPMLGSLALNAQLKAMGLLSLDDSSTDASSPLATGMSSLLTTAAGIPAPASVDNWLDDGNNDASSFNPASGDPDQPYNSKTLQSAAPADSGEALGARPSSDAPREDGADFNGDDTGDILLQNGSGGIFYVNMAGGSNVGLVSLGNAPDYTVVGSGNISGGPDANPVLQSASGQIVYENIVNGAPAGFVNVTSTPGFNVVGVGDINRDKHADIVIENLSTGQTRYIDMAGGQFNGLVDVTTAPDYTVRAVGDVQGTGYDDIVFENAGGNVVFADMTGGVFNGFTEVTNAPGYIVVGAGDIMRKGYADIVLENGAGNIVYADMANGAFNGFVNVTTTPGYKVVAIEDVTGTGYQDIVLENGFGQLVYYNTTPGSAGLVNIGSEPGFTGPHAAGGSDAVAVSNPAALGTISATDSGPAPTPQFGGVCASWLAGSSPAWTSSSLGFGGSTGAASLTDQMHQLLHPGSRM